MQTTTTPTTTTLKPEFKKKRTIQDKRNTNTHHTQTHNTTNKHINQHNTTQTHTIQTKHNIYKKRRLKHKQYF